MDTKTCALLAELNRTFYAGHADDFSRTRRGWPPGYDRILSYLPPGANVLDLGCGNGRLVAFLAARGWSGSYYGVDSNPALLDAARRVASQAAGVAAHFAQLDLLTSDWIAQLPCQRVERIACLAVLHHLPGRRNRARFLADVVRLLRPDGLLILSTWQFMAAARLRERIRPWSTVGLRPEDVEPGDYLLPWGQGGAGLRYCAWIDRDALCEMAAQAGLAPVETFYADGREGNLNLYGVFALQRAAGTA